MASASDDEKKNTEAAFVDDDLPAERAVTSAPPSVSTAGTSPVARVETGSGDALQQWRTALGTIGDMLADYAGTAVSVVPNGSQQWNVIFPPGAVRPREVCEQSERRQALEQAVAKVLGRNVRLAFSVMPGEAPRPTATVQPSNNRAQKMREVSENPYVKKLCEVIDGEILRVDPPAQNLAGKNGSAPQRQNV